jgi:hypothetical protein
VSVRAEDLFHVGIVVDDVEETLAALSALFGYEWGAQMGGPSSVRLASGEEILDLRCTYSITAPRLEIVQSVPGTLWEPVTGSGIHHVGYWSDDVAADAAALVSQGFAAEATGVLPDGAPFWAYHRGPSGPRIELVSRAVAPMLDGSQAGAPTSS